MCSSSSPSSWANTSKQAQSRLNNTKNEVRYLAGCYYDCAQFVINSGISDIGIVNRQFEQMISVYVSQGKIKKESYNKFRTVLNNTGISALKESKQKFVAIMDKGFDNNTLVTDNTGLANMQKDFMAFLEKYNVMIPDKMRMALFIELGESLAQLYEDSSIKAYFDSLANSNGLGSVEWKGPQVVTVESDGCSGSRTYYGSLWANRDRAH